MRVVSSLLLASALLIASFARPAAAQDRNIAVRPGNAPEIEILEPAEWRGEATRNITVRPRNSVRVVGLASHPSGVTEVTIDGTALDESKLASGGLLEGTSFGRQYD